jgi:ABC-2 type transport system permease protein
LAESSNEPAVRSDLAILGARRRLEIHNRFRDLLDRSRFKIVVIGTFSLLFWFSLYRLSLLGMRSINRMASQHSAELIASMFHVFFLALGVMLLFSNAIITYTSLFKSRETAFLSALPVRAESIFLYRLGESIAFSSWAFIFLATPLTAAYGTYCGLPWTYNLAVLGFYLAFLFIPAAVGSLVSMIVTVTVPRSRKGLVLAAAVIIVGGIAYLGFRVVRLPGGFNQDLRIASEVFDSIKFSENPLLPSAWLTKGILYLRDGRMDRALFFLAVIASNAVFLTALAHAAAGRLMRRGWFVSQDLPSRKRMGARAGFDVLVARILFFMSPRVRQIVIKDAKTFMRDPVQWSQFLIFFGLLGIYFSSLRSFAYEDRDLFFRNLIGQMNLLATALTLATFSSRFIFPQLSLEGRRFWVVGMMPMPREEILFGKLAFSFVASLLISETLIGISSFMLKSPPSLAALHAVALFGICMGLSGLSVGLGTLYPNFAEDNPSKIVAGFGGTLNLVLSLGFVIAVIAIQAAPWFVLFREGGPAAPDASMWVVGTMAAILVLSLAACLIPMGMALKAIRKLEI